LLSFCSVDKEQLNEVCGLSQNKGLEQIHYAGKLCF